MEFNPHKPLLPQLADAFDEVRHGRTVPAILREMARRLDAREAVDLNIARRFSVLDANLSEAGIRPSTRSE